MTERKLEVTQADREAAVTWLRVCTNHTGGQDVSPQYLVISIEKGAHHE